MAIPLKYNVRNLLVRKMTTLATAGGIALVVVVTILLLSLVAGLKRMLAATGSVNNLVVTRKGATNDGSSSVPRDAVQALRYLSGIARTPEGEPLVSPELISQPFFRPKGGGRENGLVRGGRDYRLAAVRGGRPRRNSRVRPPQVDGGRYLYRGRIGV